MTKQTILSHLIRISEIDSEIDLSLYKPEEKVFEEVKKFVVENKSEEKPSLKEIYEGLDKKVTYDDIKKSMIFLNRV